MSGVGPHPGNHQPRKRIAVADPPYLGCCGLYEHDHGGDGLCWDARYTHRRLLSYLVARFDGWALHTSSVALPEIIAIADQVDADYRIMAWVKPFAAFKANIPVAYAWEPVLVHEARKPEVIGTMVMRDWIAEPITMQRGLTGAKPERVCHWLFEVMGAHPDDDFHDLYPGSGAVSRAWQTWRGQLFHGQAS